MRDQRKITTTLRVDVGIVELVSALAKHEGRIMSARYVETAKPDHQVLAPGTGASRAMPRMTRLEALSVPSSHTLLGLLLVTLTLGTSVAPAAAEQWTHCHEAGQPHTHSRLASGVPYDARYSGYFNDDFGAPDVRRGHVSIGSDWKPADDPDWHNHGDDDAFIVSCNIPVSAYVPPAVVPGPPPAAPAVVPAPSGGGGGGGGVRPRPTATPTATAVAPVYPVAVGWVNRAGSEIALGGFIRDQSYGQTYMLVRREVDDLVVRYWVAPESSIALLVPWNTPAVRNLPTAEIRRIPLDERYPPPDMLVQLVDGRIIHWDAAWPLWRHIPDTPTFQVLGFYWCNVTAADAEFIERITLGVAHPATSLPERADYPVCG